MSQLIIQSTAIALSQLLLVLVQCHSIMLTAIAISMSHTTNAIVFKEDECRNMSIWYQLTKFVHTITRATIIRVRVPVHQLRVPVQVRVPSTTSLPKSLAFASLWWCKWPLLIEVYRVVPLDLLAKPMDYTVYT